MRDTDTMHQNYQRPGQKKRRIAFLTRTRLTSHLLLSLVLIGLSLSPASGQTCNTPPLTQVDTVTTRQNESVLIDVLANDSDPDGQELSVLLQGSPTGTLADHGDGSFSYTPPTGFEGTTSFSYRVTDGIATSSPVSVTITVEADTGGPQAVADSFATARDTPLVILFADLLANDVGAGLAVVAWSPPSHGHLVATPANGLTYHPAAGVVEDATFTYTVEDADLKTDTATVTVRIDPPPPAPQDDSFSTLQDTPITILESQLLENDGGEGISIIGYGSPTHGSLSSAPGQVTYTPDPGFIGQDVFTYTVRNVLGQDDIANVWITVGPPLPVAADDSVTARQNIPLVILESHLLQNDTGHGIAIVSYGSPSQGGLTVGAGEVTYTPNPGFFGQDSFSYLIEDSLGRPDQATVFVSVEPPLPVARDDVYNQARQDTPLVIFESVLLQNDLGEGITVVGYGNPMHGSLSFALGQATYTPDPGFIGQDVFTYTILDVLERDASGNITINVEPLPPVANDDAVSTPQETPVVVLEATLLQNDSGVGISVVGYGSPSNGALSVAPGQVTYTPNPGFFGQDSFTYTIEDNRNRPATAYVSISVIDTQPPLASFTASCVDRTCTFDAGSSSDNDAIASYSWDFGDGSSGTGALAIHEFAVDGLYTVRLTLTDSSGNASTTELGIELVDLIELILQTLW